ncbi:MAG TPA: epoxyqueuosine reductase QueH [Pseudobacteroides sp.]|uniref:epoxyqueuosine reductase QueH n=1 Tax=Pseudobacteroides sp. TaxID=1968840 RepID=UPI002F92EA42
MKLLLHMCCAPCSVYPISVIKDENIGFEGIFYNPNIHPIEEFNLRKENVGILSKVIDFPVAYFDEFMQQDWASYKGDGEERCFFCYSMRLHKVAEYAADKGFDSFTTSLLVSPYQKHELIKELGEKAAQKYGIDFYYRDFRPGFRQGQQQAKEMGLYRQKFCGCIISYEEAQSRIKRP